MPCYLIRHPELPDVAGVCYGRLDHRPAESAIGAAVRQIVPLLMSRLLPDPNGNTGLPDRLGAIQIWSSPLQRCQLLAGALMAALDVNQKTGRGSDNTGLTVPALAPEVSADLMELDFGAWEGLRWDDIPRADLDRWASDPWDFQPGGRESARDVLGRWLRFKATAVDTAPDVHHVVVTHAGIIRLALWHAGQLNSDDLWLHRVPHATPIEIQC